MALLPPAWRTVAGLCAALAVVTLPTYLIATFVLPPVPPIVMIRSFAVGTALPALVAWAILRTFRGSAEVVGPHLRLQRPDLSVEVPASAIAAVRAWWVPLPGPGLSIALATGARLPVGIALRDPSALLDRLAAAGIDVERSRRQPAAIAASTRRPRRWFAPVVKFVGFGTLPALLLFYTHQHIAYGGTWGQYHLEGPLAWLTTLAQYWATTLILLVSYASIWRIAGETLVWLAAWAGVRAATIVRRAVGGICAVAYWAGVPAFLALRYLA